MNQEELAEKVAEIISIFEEAASVEKMLPNRDRAMLDARSGWVDYVYDADDRKDQEVEFRKERPTAKQIDILNKALRWRDMLGMRKDTRTVRRKQILWARACGFSYRDIAFVVGMPPQTVQDWYKRDISFLTKKIFILQ